MKKLITIALGFAVLSSGAFASKARMEALGQDANGSMYLDDARNVMLNPAMLNFHKDFITMEWGATNNGVAGDPDSASAPKAEGGMFKAAGNMVYGLYLGSESNTSNALRTVAMGASVIEEQNNTDFFVAGDAGVQWGVRLTYHDFKDKQLATTTKSSAMRAVIGVISGNIETYLNFGLGNKAEKGGAKFNGKSSMDLGVTYNKGDVDYMLRYQTIEAENTTSKKFKAANTHIGVAKAYKLNDKANAWASAWYKMDTSDNNFAAAVGSLAVGAQKDTYLPVSIGLEVAAKEWLTIRGSIGQNVIINSTENDAGDVKTMADTTLVAAGLGLNFGDLTIDGMIGNNTGATVAAGENNTSTGGGALRTDVLMSRVGVTYKF